MFEIGIFLEQLEIGISCGEKPIFRPKVDSLLQVIECLVTIALNRIRGRERIKHMVSSGCELQGVLQVLNGRRNLASIQVGDTDVVVVISGSENCSRLLLKFFFRCVNKNFRAFLNLRFFGMLRDEFFKASDRLFEFLGMHQLEAGFVGLDGVRKVLRADTWR